MEMESYLHETWILEHIAEAQRHAARRPLIGSPRPSRGPRHRWAIIHQLVRGAFVRRKTVVGNRATP